MRKVSQLIILLLFFLGIALPCGVYVESLAKPKPYGSMNKMSLSVTINGSMADVTISQEIFSHESSDFYMLYPEPSTAIKNFSVAANGTPLSISRYGVDDANQFLMQKSVELSDERLLALGNAALNHSSISNQNKETSITSKFSMPIQCQENFCKFSLPFLLSQMQDVYVKDVDVSIRIKGGSSYHLYYSPDIPFMKKRSDNSSDLNVYYSARNALIPQNINFYYSRETENVLAKMMIYHHYDRSYFLTLASAKSNQSASVIGKDMVYVIDHSGSMGSQKKIENVKSVLLKAIDNLSSNDRFNIIPFSSNPTNLFDELIEVNGTNIDSAKNAVSSLRAGGGTNIKNALTLAFQQYKTIDRPRYLVFLTDGQGVNKVEVVIDALSGFKINPRMMAFGVGSSVNTLLLDKLTNVYQGSSVYLKPEDQIELKINEFLNGITSPIVTGPKLMVSQGDVDQIFTHRYPPIMNDLFKSSLSIQNGVADKVSLPDVMLFGNQEGQLKKWDVNIIPDFAFDNLFIAELWAEKRIIELIEQMELNEMSKAEKDVLVDEIQKLSMEFGVNNPFTQFLLKPKTYSKKLNNQQDSSNINCVQNNQRACPSSLDINTRDEFYQVLDQVSGNTAYDRASTKNNMKNVNHRTSNNSNKLRNSNGRIFVPDNNGVWVDHSFEEGKPIKQMDYGKKEYQDFFINNPETGVYLAMSKNVLFKHKDQNYFVHDSNTVLDESVVGLIAKRSDSKHILNQGHFIDFPGQTGKVNIYNQQGKVIQQASIINGRVHVDKLSRGQYWVGKPGNMKRVLILD